MSIREYLVELLGEATESFNKVMNWEKWTIPNNYLNRCKINEILLNEYKLYGHSANNMRLIHLNKNVLLINEKEDVIELVLSDETTKACFVIPYQNRKENEVVENVDFFQSFITEYHYSNIKPELINLLFDKAEDSSIKKEDADFKAWHFTDGLLVRSVAMPVPELKMVYDDNTAIVYGENILFALPLGYIIVNKISEQVMVCSYSNHLSIKKAFKALNTLPNQKGLTKLFDAMTNKEENPFDGCVYEAEVFSTIINKL